LRLIVSLAECLMGMVSGSGGGIEVIF